MTRRFSNSLFLILFFIASAIPFRTCLLNCDHAHFDDVSSFVSNNHDDADEHLAHSHGHRHSEDSPYHEHEHGHLSKPTPDDKFIQDKIVLPAPMILIKEKVAFFLPTLFSDVCLPNFLRPPIS